MKERMCKPIPILRPHFSPTPLLWNISSSNHPSLCSRSLGIRLVCIAFHPWRNVHRACLPASQCACLYSQHPQFTCLQFLQYFTLSTSMDSDFCWQGQTAKIKLIEPLWQKDFPSEMSFLISPVSWILAQPLSPILSSPSEGKLLCYGQEKQRTVWSFDDFLT